MSVNSRGGDDMQTLITNQDRSRQGESSSAPPVDPGAAAVPTKNKLDTLNGVYIPCLLNILGAVLFMRVGYVVGYVLSFA
jgi:hypothetical protein